MTKHLKEDIATMLQKLEHLKKRMYDDVNIVAMASDDVIKSVATSDEIAKELKEILIVWHSTLGTEFKEAKISNYRINLDIVDTIDAVISMQNKIIAKLVEHEESRIAEITRKETARTRWYNIIMSYKVPFSVIVVVSTLWLLATINPEAMELVKGYLPSSATGVK